MADELLKWRLEFPILGNTVYLISHSLGAMPRETFTRLTEYAETWATRGVRAWAEGWWDMPVTTGNDVALIIGAELLKAVLIYPFSPVELSGEISSEPWHRIYVAASHIPALSTVGVGVLFLAGLRRWSRPEGSWMFLLGTLLAVVAIIFGSMAVLVLTAIDDEQLILDLRVRFVWLDISDTFGLISIGFFFLAYRGLSESSA